MFSIKYAKGNTMPLKHKLFAPSFAEGGPVGNFGPKEQQGYDVHLPRVSVDDRYPGRSSASVGQDLGGGFSVEGSRRQWRDEPPAYGARLTYKKEF